MDNPKCRRSAAEEQEYQQNIATFIAKATPLLHEYENQQYTMEAEHDRSGAKTKAGLTRKLNSLRRALEKDILALSREHGIVTGKWMLFPPGECVDTFWSKVVRGTYEGQMGIGAKIATDVGRKRARLLAVYTKDLLDTDDAARVLGELMRLEMVRDDAENHKTIYYKADAFTYLGIMGDNPYGLKASLFSSKDVLTKQHELMERIEELGGG